jgi:hypothetical protein
MVERTEREKWLSIVMQWMAENPDSRIVVIMQHGPRSLSTMTSFDDQIIAMGMVTACEKLGDEAFRFGVRQGFMDGSQEAHVKKMQAYGETAEKAKN